MDREGLAEKKPRVSLAAVVAAGAAFAFFAISLVLFGPELLRMAGQASFLGAFRTERAEQEVSKSVAAAPRQPAGEGAVDASARGASVVQVQLAKALTAHPRYEELLLLEREIARRQQNGAGSGSAGAGAPRAVNVPLTPDAVIEAHTRSSADAYVRDSGQLAKTAAERLQDEEKRLQLEIQQKVDWKRSELADKLDEEIGLERDRHTKELEKFIEDTNRRFAVKILNAQLQANILNTDAARRQASEEVKALEAQAAKLIETEKEEHAKALSAYSARLNAAYEKQLKDYAAALSQEASAELSAIRRSLEDSNAEARSVLDKARSVSREALNAIESSENRLEAAENALPLAGGGRSQPDPGLRRLQEQRERLLESMKNDIRQAAAKIANRMGAKVLEFVPTGDQNRDASAAASESVIDITAQVMGILEKQ